MGIELSKNNKALFAAVPLAMSSLVSCNDDNSVRKDLENIMLKEKTEIIQVTREDIAKDSLFSFIDQLNSEDMKLFLSFTLPRSFDFKKIEDIDRYIKIREYIVSKGTYTKGDMDDKVEKQIKVNLYFLSFKTLADLEQYVTIRNYIVVNLTFSTDDIDSYVFDRIIEQLAQNDFNTPEGLRTYIEARDYIAKHLHLDTKEIDEAVKYEKSPKPSVRT